MLDELQEKMFDALIECDTETAVLTFIQYYGTQILDEGFKEHLTDEGIMEEDEDEEDY